MGAWGWKLYQCDEARDIKDAFKDIKNYPFSEDQFLKHFEINLDGLNSEDFDQTIACLSVYDQLHQYGIDAPRLKKCVQHIIEDGIDIQLHRDLEMRERDLEKRAKHLDELWSIWKDPHPKPKRRKPLDPNVSFLFDVGDVVLFPTEKGWPRMDRRSWWEEQCFDHSLKGKPAPDINPDGWGAFVVLDQTKIDGLIPRSLILRIAFDPSDKKPEIDDVWDGFIAGNKFVIPLYDALGFVRVNSTTTIPNAYGMYIHEQISWLEIAKADLKFLSLQKIGNIKLDKDRILADLHRFHIDMHWCHRNAAWLSAREEDREIAKDVPPSKAPDYSTPYFSAELNPREKQTLSRFLFADPYPGKEDAVDKPRRDWKSNGHKIGMLPLKEFPLAQYKPGQEGVTREAPYYQPLDLISYLPNEPHLSGSELAQKVAASFRHFEPLAFNVDDLIEAYKKHAPRLIFSEDAAPNIFLFALLDCCHLFNIDAPDLLEQAKDLILNGKDEQTYRDLGMDEEDLSIRRKDLRGHLEHWCVPHPEPLPRTCVDPENPFDFEVGDIILFKTRNGYGFSPMEAGGYGPSPEEWEAEFLKDADGWGAALIVERALLEGTDDQYKAVRLFIDGRDEPDLDGVKQGCVAIHRLYNRDLDFIFDEFIVEALKLREVDLPSYHAKKLGSIGPGLNIAAMMQDLKNFNERQFYEKRAHIVNKLEAAEKRGKADLVSEFQYELKNLDEGRETHYLSLVDFEFSFDMACNIEGITKCRELCHKMSDPRASGLRPDIRRPLSAYLKG